MAAIALIRFSQGALIGGAGHALVVEPGVQVTIDNVGDNTSVGSWRISLVYGPPGSSFERAPNNPLVLAEAVTGNLPVANIIPELAFYGCYRVLLQVWTGTGYTGTLDSDVRNICVLTPNKRFVLPPYQGFPEPLPSTGSGLPGEKPNELNFGGQPFGWSGDENDSRRLLNATLLAVDAPEAVSDLTSLASLPIGQSRMVLYLRGRTTPMDGGEGWFAWSSADESANIALDPQMGIYVPPTSDPTGASGAWVRVWRDFVKVEWFGARGDAERPSESTGTPTGTDDSAAVLAARTFLQSVAFQPNLYVGNWGGYRLEFSSNKAYRLSGHNVLGTTLERSTAPGDAGSLQRQNWHVSGNGCLLLWTPTTADDALIESHETLVRQVYQDFTVVPCGLTGAMGWLYKNTANSGRNATHIHKFEGVQTATVGATSAASATVGLKGLFRYEGDNLGDRLQTERCSFHQFETGLYSENAEAVSQHFSDTTFTSYIDGAVFFYLRRHGSGFSVRGCELLCKGEGCTLFKTEYMSGVATGSNGAHVTASIAGSRLEVAGGKTFTMVDAEFGMIEVSDLTTVPGGLPSLASELLVVRGSAVVTLQNCALYGRVVLGAPLVTSYLVRRRYQLVLRGCLFLMDLSQHLYAIDGSGTRVIYKDAIIGAYERPALLVEDTNSRSVNWEGLTNDPDHYIMDGVYFGTNWPNLNPHERTLMCGRYRTSAQRWYLDNASYFVLPACCVVTSVRLTRAMVPASVADEIELTVGSATLSIPLDNTAVQNEEVLAPDAIVISDDVKAERLLSLQVKLAGVDVASPSIQGFIEITYRQACGLNEITTAETGGVHLTRVVTTGFGERRSLAESVASGGTTSNIDITIPSTTGARFQVEVMAEDAAGDRASIVALVETMRSGAAVPTTPTVATLLTAGTGLTLNATSTGTVLRLNTTNTMGADAHITTRVVRVSRWVTVEDS